MAAVKAVEAAITAAVPCSPMLQTPQANAPARDSSSKRVSFGPYVSPEYIDKVSNDSFCLKLINSKYVKNLFNDSK